MKEKKSRFLNTNETFSFIYFFLLALPNWQIGRQQGKPLWSFSGAAGPYGTLSKKKYTKPWTQGRFWDWIQQTCTFFYISLPWYIWVKLSVGHSRAEWLCEVRCKCLTLIFTPCCLQDYKRSYVTVESTILSYSK